MQDIRLFELLEAFKNGKFKSDEFSEEDLNYLLRESYLSESVVKTKPITGGKYSETLFDDKTKIRYLLTQKGRQKLFELKNKI